VSDQTYLVAVDGSEWGDRAADHAVSMAKTSGATVRLITVVPWSKIKPMAVDNAAHRPIDKEEEPKIKNQILTPILKRHENSGVDVSFEIHWGDPVDTITERVKGHSAVTQVYAGRRGRSRVADLMVGSVANSLAHTIDKPIVLVP